MTINKNVGAKRRKHTIDSKVKCIFSCPKTSAKISEQFRLITNFTGTIVNVWIHLSVIHHCFCFSPLPVIAVPNKLMLKTTIQTEMLLKVNANHMQAFSVHLCVCVCVCVLVIMCAIIIYNFSSVHSMWASALDTFNSKGFDTLM